MRCPVPPCPPSANDRIPRPIATPRAFAATPACCPGISTFACTPTRIGNRLRRPRQERRAARVQRLHCVTVRVEIIYRLAPPCRRAAMQDRPCAIGSRSLTLSLQRVRQDALHRDKFNRRSHFQVALDAHQIQRHEILPGLDHRPAADCLLARTPSVCTSIFWMANASFL